MAGFVFNLEPVLRQRRLTEEQRQRELARLLSQKLTLEEQLRGFQQTLRSSKHALGDTLLGPVDLARVAQFTRYHAQVRAHAHGAVVKLAQLEKAVEQARALVVEASKARRALELLRDRRREAYLREQARREAAELDAIAIERHARRR